MNSPKGVWKIPEHTPCQQNTPTKTHLFLLKVLHFFGMLHLKIPWSPTCFTLKSSLEKEMPKLKNPSFSGFHHSFNLRGDLCKNSSMNPWKKSMVISEPPKNMHKKDRKRPHLYKRTPKWDGWVTLLRGFLWPPTIGDEKVTTWITWTPDVCFTLPSKPENCGTSAKILAAWSSLPSVSPRISRKLSTVMKPELSASNLQKVGEIGRDFTHPKGWCQKPVVLLHG